MSGLAFADAVHAGDSGLDPQLVLAPQDAEWTARRYGYRLGSLGFLVGETTRSEVVRAPVISPLPHTPGWLLGLMNLRGNLVPVADLRALCGGAAESRTPATVLVLDAGERAIAIPIEELPRALVDLRPLAEFPDLPPVVAAHAGPAFESEGSIWIGFDHTEFFRALAQGPGASY